MTIESKDFDNIYELSKNRLSGYEPSNPDTDIKDEIKLWYKNGKLYGIADSYSHQEWIENDMPKECHEDLNSEVEQYIEDNNINEHDGYLVADAYITIACKHGWIRISRAGSEVLVQVYDMSKLDNLKDAILDFPKIFRTKYSDDIRLVDCVSNKYHIFHGIKSLLNY